MGASHNPISVEWGCAPEVATADGQPVTAFYRDALAQAVRRTQANIATTVRTVQVTSSDPAWIDVVTFGQPA